MESTCVVARPGLDRMAWVVSCTVLQNYYAYPSSSSSGAASPDMPSRRSRIPTHFALVSHRFVSHAQQGSLLIPGASLLLRRPENNEADNNIHNNNDNSATIPIIRSHLSPRKHTNKRHLFMGLCMGVYL